MNEEKYEEFVNFTCEMLGLNKPIDILKLCQLTSAFIRPYEMKIKELEKEKCELLGIIQKKDELIKNLICCANCKHGTQGDYDCFENCGSCHATDCECEIKSPTKNSSGKYHDWDDKCDNWELAE